mgnify:CR=1 FL=1
MTDEKTPPNEGPGEPKPFHLKPVDGDTKDAPPVLIPKHLEDLEASGLNAETIAACGIYSETASAPVAACLGYAWRGGGGMIIPFRDYDSRAIIFRRVKPDKPRFRVRKGKKKPVKYEHPRAIATAPYFGPSTLNKQRLGSENRIVWTEGEKKTLALDQMGFAAIGLTGVHNFNDAKKLKNGDGLAWHPALVKIAGRYIANKDHYIVFDSDSMTNDDVMFAARRLAGLLLDTKARSVRFVVIPGGEKKLGIDDYLVEHGEAKAKALFDVAAKVAMGEELEPIAPRDPLVKLDSLAWLKPAKVSPDLRLPPRFEIRRDRSLWIEPLDPQADMKELTRSVVLPVRLMREHAGEAERVELAWFVRGEWRRAVVNRHSLRDSRRLLADTPPSMAITSNNASAIVAWFEEYMRHNETRLRCVSYVSVGGWQDNIAGTCFMLDQPIARGVEETLVGDDMGDSAKTLSALKPKGSYDKHIGVLREAFEADDTAAIAILAALAAPLLKVFNAPNFTINLYGDSSTGKTSMMKVATSTYGDPSSPQWVASWNASAAAMEARAQVLCDLPLPFDEVGSGEQRAIEKSVYMLNNGTGRARSNQQLGTRETASWRSIVFSTGEHQLVDRHATTGAQIRVLQFNVVRFGGERGAAWVDTMRDTCEANSGNVGRRWIEALVDVDDWRGVIEEYEDAKAWFRENAQGQLMKRQAVYFALMWMAECLAHEYLGLGDENGETVKAFFLDEDNREEIESASTRALECVSQWLASSAESFPALVSDAGGKLKTERKQVGARLLAGVRHGTRVYVLTSALRDRLSKEGINYSEACGGWKREGFTACDSKRMDTRVKFNGERVRVVSLSCEALGVEPLDEDEAAREFQDA